MEWLQEWLRQLLVLIVLAAFFDLVVSDQAMQKYIKLVVSLCILLSLLAPIVKLVGGDVLAQLEQKVTDEMKRWTAEPVATTATGTLQQEQTQRLLAQQMAAELSAYLNREHQLSRICSVELAGTVPAEANTDNDRMHIEQISCRDGPAPMLQPETNVELVPMADIVVDVDIQSSSPSQPNQSEKNNAIEIAVREYIQKEWSLEVLQVDVE